MTLSGRGHEFLTLVRQAADGTPYVVTETERGFDVTIDIVDATWFGVLNKAGLAKVYTHHVAMTGDDAYTVTDDTRTVEWVAGVPQVRGSVERVQGRVKEFGVLKVWAFDKRGRFGVQADYRFNSEEGRNLVNGVAQQLELAEKLGAAEKTGLIVGLVAAAGSVITVIVLIVMALTGKF